MSTELLDAIFLLFFSQFMPGEVVTLEDIHKEYDYRNRSVLTKQELEYVINKQIAMKKLKPISSTEFEVGNYNNSVSTYRITDAIYNKSILKYKPIPHPLWQQSAPNK